MDDEQAKVFLGNYLGWSLYRSGSEFYAILTNMRQDSKPPLRAKTERDLRIAIDGSDLIESATI